MTVMRSLCLLLLVMTACRLSGFDPNSAAVDIVVDREVRVGELATVTIVITNNSESDMRVADSACDPFFEVINASGNVVGPRMGGICTPIAKAPISLRPRESHTIVSGWDGSGGRGEQSMFLPDGEYRIRARVIVESGWRFSEAKPVSLSSVR